MKKYNFSAGPSILPQYTIDQTAAAVKDLDGIGLSILEMSHRSKEYEAINRETASLFKEILSIPDGYQVIFVGGGASTQFFTVPYNLLQTKAAYLVTGDWAKKAAKEAKIFGEVEIVASSEDKLYNYIPRDYTVPQDVDYFHITSNNTIFGTQIKEDLDVGVPLVADMSSDIFSRPVDISKYALIYGGAQKNLAPAGVTFVIIKEDILGKVDRPLPTMVDYRTHIKKESSFNTPPVVVIYAALQTLKWLKQLGGVEVIEKINIEKAKVLYDEIERNKMFAPTIMNEADRSIMNIPFVMADGYKELEADFLKFATEQGMVSIKGHRSVGGFRASLYNAMPIESVKALTACMQAFEANH